MSKPHIPIRELLITACTMLLLGLAGCSSDDSTPAATTTTSTANALPQPSVNCDGSSCID